MSRSSSSDRFVRLSGIATALLGFSYAAIWLMLARAPAGPSEFARFEQFLALMLVVSALVWLIALLSRRHHRHHRQTAQVTHRRDSRSRSSTHSSTMQTQWRHSDPATAWANTHHDTRERTTSSERNSQIDGWFNSSVQSSGLGQDSLQRNSIQPNSLQSHTIAPSVQLRHAIAPICWTVELLQELEWRRFDTIAAEFFSSIGLTARPVDQGPGHEINLRVWQTDQSALHALVRTRAGAPVIDIEAVRTFYAVMTRERVGQGFFLTAGRFSTEAVNASRGTGLFLIDGATLYKRIVSLPAAQQEGLLQRATGGDYRSPSCPDCGRTMALRSGDFKAFWRCIGYPACKARMVLAADGNSLIG